MTVQINGTNGLQFNDASSMASAQVGMKNRIIDGGFTINQRGYVSGTSLSSGTYAHDRWKAGASGCTYTFTQGSLGVNTTITITAGSLIQVIEGANLPEGGTYVLSWTGTANARLNGGAYSPSGVTITGWVAGTNLNVEFGTGTCGNIQLEKGSTATSFDYRPYGTELQLCQRYAYMISLTGAGDFGVGACTAGGVQAYVPYPVTMRAAPTVTFSTAGNFVIADGIAGYTVTSTGTSNITTNQTTVNMGASGITGGRAGLLRYNTGTAFILFSAEL